MSDKEKALLEKIAAMPAPMQQRFIDKADGALMAIEAMRDAAGDGDEKKEETE